MECKKEDKCLPPSFLMPSYKPISKCGVRPWYSRLGQSCAAAWSMLMIFYVAGKFPVGLRTDRVPYVSVYLGFFLFSKLCLEPTVGLFRCLHRTGLLVPFLSFYYYFPLSNIVLYDRSICDIVNQGMVEFGWLSDKYDFWPGLVFVNSTRFAFLVLPAASGDSWFLFTHVLYNDW